MGGNFHLCKRTENFLGHNFLKTMVESIFSALIFIKIVSHFSIKHLLEIVIKDNITSLLSVNDSEKIKTSN